MSTAHLRGRGRGAALAFLTACACTLLVPSLAGAATVSASSGQLSLRAASGELNTLTMSAETLGPNHQRTTFRDDSTPLVAGEGCLQTTPNSVTCETDRYVVVDFTLDDGHDRLTFDSGPFMRVKVHAGTGDDTVTNIAVDNDHSFGHEIYGDEGNDQLSSYGLVHGGDGNDRVEGGPEANTLIGGTGNDSLFGREGNDDLYGGNGPWGGGARAGSDALDGGAGDDTLTDQDRISRTVEEINADSITGGVGTDTVRSYANRVANVYVNLDEPRRDGQTGEGDDLVGVENLYGGDGDDRLYGDGDTNFISGEAGDDQVAGRGGDDELIATQADSVSGDRGRDRIVAYRDSTGYLRCASGGDLVSLISATSTPRPRDIRTAPRISKTCERVEWRGIRFKPTPTRIRPSGRITFGRLPFEGMRFLLTRATRPYSELARIKIPAHSFSLQLPRDLVRKHKKMVRVKIGGQLIYRFRLGG